MAAKNKMDLNADGYFARQFNTNSSFWYCCARTGVILSTFVGPVQLNLTFPRSLIVVLFLTVILAAMIAGDGRSQLV